MYNVLESEISGAVSSLPLFLQGEKGSTERAEQETQAVNELTDELTVAIALRRWKEAVEITERGRERLTVLPSLAPKLTSLTTSLTSALLHTLSDSSLSKSSVISVTSLLLRLNEGVAARDTFLSTRNSLTKKRTRMIAFEGEVSSYVAELAFVVFTSIKHTANWYLASFEENEIASTLTQWAKEQIENFSVMFKRQVQGPHVEQKDVDASILIMLDQNRKILHDNGMDFSHLLISLIEPLALSPLGAASVAPKSSLDSTVDPLGASLDFPQPSTAQSPTSPLKLSSPPVVPHLSSPLPSYLAVLEKSSSGNAPSDPTILSGVRSRPPRSPGPRPMRNLQPQGASGQVL